MLPAWLPFSLLYIFFAVIYFQTYKLAVKHAVDDGAATILLQLIAGISVLLFFPFFPFRIPTDMKFYLFLLLSCVFYAMSDRSATPARKHLPVSTFSILNQLTSAFLVIIGLLFFKDQFLWSKIIGGILILGTNIFIFYEKGKFKLNKYAIFGVFSTITLAIALSIDIGISKNFNLAFYSGLVFILPAIIITLSQRISFFTMTEEIKKAPLWYLITGLFWGLTLLCALRAYQLGRISTVVPFGATFVLINVIVAHVFFHERKDILKKVIAAFIVILGIFLTVR